MTLFQPLLLHDFTSTNKRKAWQRGLDGVFCATQSEFYSKSNPRPENRRSVHLTSQTCPERQGYRKGRDAHQQLRVTHNIEPTKLITGTPVIHIAIPTKRGFACAFVATGLKAAYALIPGPLLVTLHNPPMIRLPAYMGNWRMWDEAHSTNDISTYRKRILGLQTAFGMRMGQQKDDVGRGNQV